MTNDEQLRGAYEAGLTRGEPRPPLDDLASERLRRLVEREGSEAERLHQIDTLLASREGRQELEIAWAAARAARAVPSWELWRRAAAVVLLAVGAGGVFFSRADRSQEMRGQESPITLVAPLGTIAPTTEGRFVWRAVSDADQYTLVVVDSAGNELFAGETRDTAVTLPDTIRLETGKSYLWWVQARTRLGESVTAVTQRVTITAP